MNKEKDINDLIARAAEIANLKPGDQFPAFDHDSFISGLESELSSDDLYAVDVVHSQLWALFPREDSFEGEYKDDSISRGHAIMIVHRLKHRGVVLLVKDQT